MGGWHAVEGFISEAGKHSTWAGKFYNTFFDVFRLLFLVSIVDNTFKDKKLKCDTKMPGCSQMCTNRFLPIDVIVFWAIQIFTVCLPTVIYMTYVVHKTKEIKDARARREEVEGKAREKRKIELTFEKKFIQACKDEIILTDGHIVAETEQMEFVLQDVEEEAKMLEEDAEIVEKVCKEEIMATKAMDRSSMTPPKLFLGYFSMVLCRTLIEAGFISFYFKIYIFDLVMPKIYYCDATPCLSKTSCFVSRPNEKTYVLHIMFILACFTLSCSIFELLNLGLSAPIKAWKNRHKDITNDPRYAPEEHTLIPTFAA